MINIINIKNYLEKKELFFSNNFFIKIKIIFIFILILSKKININNKIKVEIDNELKISLYENDINFSNYSSEIKPIAIYIPQFKYKIYNINTFKNEVIDNYNLNFFKPNISKYNIIYNNKEYNISFISNIISNKIKLAKNHGIYGFAIYYELDYDIDSIYSDIDIVFENKYNKFPFFLIWKNDNLEYFFKEFKITELNFIIFKYIINKLIKNIKKYLISNIYIKIHEKPVLSINKPFIFPNLKKYILLLRQKSIENKIGEIFILFPNNKEIDDVKNFNIYDASYDISKINIFKDKEKFYNITYYLGIIYKNINYNKNLINFNIYRESFLDLKYNINSKNNGLKDISPEKYYILNKIIFDWTNINYNQSYKFIFINSWNNYIEGNYLEPDRIYGYSFINSFSKALFNISFKKNNNNINYFLKGKIFIAVQAHVFYEDLIDDIINKTNNIPYKYDLYISTISIKKKLFIENFVKNKSNANYYEIKIVENKGRDVLPLINQLKNIIKKYKYFCHIHTKKSKHDIILGNKWRNYLYDNLLGNREIIIGILSDFEKYKKLGFIFPEVYYDIIKKIDDYDNTDFFLHKFNKDQMNLILKIIFHKYEVGNKLLFPSGNMFWAKVKAVYQIFSARLEKFFPEEKNQTNSTIMHAIERIWLYLVKLNGYFYKKIFYHY